MWSQLHDIYQTNPAFLMRIWLGILCFNTVNQWEIMTQSSCRKRKSVRAIVFNPSCVSIYNLSMQNSKKNKLFYIMIMRNFYFLSSWLRWVLKSSSPGLLKNGQKLFCYDLEPEKITKSKCRQFYGTPCILLTFLWIFLEFLPLWIILSSTLPVFRVPECWPLSN